SPAAPGRARPRRRSRPTARAGEGIDDGTVRHRLRSCRAVAAGARIVATRCTEPCATATARDEQSVGERISARAHVAGTAPGTSQQGDAARAGACSGVRAAAVEAPGDRAVIRESAPVLADPTDAQVQRRAWRQRDRSLYVCTLAAGTAR